MYYILVLSSSPWSVNGLSSYTWDITPVIFSQICINIRKACKKIVQEESLLGKQNNLKPIFLREVYTLSSYAEK